MSYSTTNGTSGESDRITWEDSGVAFVKKFKYLKKKNGYENCDSFEIGGGVVKVPECKCEIDSLLHIDDNAFFFFINISTLSQVDFCISDITLGTECDTTLCHSDLNRFSNIW